jgi:hypothetical protein
VYYTADAPPHLPFPPPRSSLLRRTIDALRAARRITPRLRMIHAARDDAGPFLRHLLEEPERAADGRVTYLGMVQFLDDVQQEVWEDLKEQGYGQSAS